jgi:membrane-bound lytic murein transglycosylase F
MKTRRRPRLAGWLTYLATATVIPASVTTFYWFRKPVDLSFLSRLAASIASLDRVDLRSRISAYDEIIQRHSRMHGLDWRLVASIIHTESTFKEDAISPMGALGLMQVMPVVAQEQNTTLSAHPARNIELGLAHFTSKMKRIKGATPDDTLRLSLAAYNTGLGHLRDAQNLAIERGLSPRQWKNVSEMFLLLEEPEISDSTKYGYCPGSSVVTYVEKVLRRYQKYRALYPDEPTQALEAGIVPPAAPST